MSAVKVPASRQASTTVGDVCDDFGGEVQTGPFGSQLHSSDYSKDGIPVVMPQDMQDGRVTTARIARVGPAHVARLRQHCLREGDIVFSRRGDVARFAVITGREDGWLCGTGSMRIRLNCPDIEVGYLRRYLSQPSIGAWLAHNAKGVTMPNLNTAIIRALPLVYPPLSEQRRIAAILDRADALRAKRQEALAQLDSLTQSIFVEMFGDPAVNPRGWPQLTVGSTAAKFSDGPFGSNLKSAHYTEAGVRVIRLQNIGVGELIDKDKAFISEEHFNKLCKHECLPGDVLIGTLGDPNLRACIQPASLGRALNKADCVQLRPDPNVANAPYLCALLNQPAVEALAQEFMLGQTRVRISMGRLRGLRIPVPPLALQQTFANHIEAVESLKATHRSALFESDALFASLQHRAFAGQL